MNGMTKTRFWLKSIAVWLVAVAAFLVLFTLISKHGGAPYWLVSLIVSWLPFLFLVGFWVWFSRRNGRASSGVSWVDLYEQQLVEYRRTNALLERIAAALEKPSPG